MDVPTSFLGLRAFALVCPRPGTPSLLSSPIRFLLTPHSSAHSFIHALASTW